MNKAKFLKTLHVCGTLWFLLCAAALLILSLRQAGFRWWIIFSISGYSAVVVFFLLTIYLFAIFQGVVRSQNPIEHPLTTSSSYIILYDAAPFLGLISGLLAAPSLSWILLLNAIAQGTLAMTFVMWIFIDPLIGLLESVLPKSTAARKERICRQRCLKIQLKHENEQMLVRLEQQENALRMQWSLLFADYAKEAASLLCSDDDPSETTRRRLIELGAMAWQQGQFTCMQQFHEMILHQIRIRPDPPSVDFAALWWDGIGVWRRPEISCLILKPPAPEPNDKTLLQPS